MKTPDDLERFLYQVESSHDRIAAELRACLPAAHRGDPQARADLFAAIYAYQVVVAANVTRLVEGFDLLPHPGNPNGR